MWMLFVYELWHNVFLFETKNVFVKYLQSINGVDARCSLHKSSKERNDGTPIVFVRINRVRAVSRSSEIAWTTSKGLDCSIKTNCCVPWLMRSHSISHEALYASPRWDHTSTEVISWRSHRSDEIRLDIAQINAACSSREEGDGNYACKLTVELISKDATDQGDDEKGVEQLRHCASDVEREADYGKENVRSGCSPRSEATFIRTGIEGCLPRS